MHFLTTRKTMPPALLSTPYLNVTFYDDLFNGSRTEVNNTFTSGSTEGANVTATMNRNIREMTWDDATWILTSSFIIFTMQSGGLYLQLSYSQCNQVGYIYSYHRMTRQCNGHRIKYVVAFLSSFLTCNV